MANATVDLCNQALGKIGASTINSITQATEEARRANAIFKQSLDYLLQLFSWNFAVTRKTLARDVDDPTFEWTFQYQLPTDPWCLRPLSLYGGGSYEIVAGRKLLTNQDSAQLVYIKRVTDMNDLSASFKETFVNYLAAQLAFPLTKDASLKKEMELAFEKSLARAKLMDSKESTPPTQARGSWLDVRSVGRRSS